MTGENYADRISFIKERQVMDVDFSNLTFDVSGTVNRVYDAIDEKITKTKKKWFFLVNYENCTILPEAWITFAHRGKKLNIAYSIGSVRYGASQSVSSAVKERSEVESFDPNLFATRDAALEHLDALRTSYDKKEFAELIKLDETVAERSYEDRISFHPDVQIMEADFSDLTFERSADVNRFYDLLEEKIEATGKKWYFLVNYRNCTIMPESWIAFAGRGKRANINHSLGSVRFAASSSTGEAIEADAVKQDFDANLLSSRDDAIAELLKMKDEAGH